MEKIKSVLITLLAAFVVFSGVGTMNVKAEGKVKVYIFEAGGCPYCEAEIEYLKGLDSYNEKFEIVQKELYVDHVDWAQGKDYQLGKKVAEAFKSAGFENAAYTGTPFVVISDLYAAATYSTDLEKYINQAYEEGDKDVVGCFANDGDECLKGQKKDNSETIQTIVVLLIIAGSVALVIYTGKRNAKLENEVPYKKITKEDDGLEEDDDDEEIVIKKVEKKEKTPVKAKKNTKTQPKKSNNRKK